MVGEDFSEFSLEAGDKAVIDAAKALAMTAADLVAPPDMLARAKAELEETHKRESVTT